MHYGNTKKAERERQRRQATDLAQVAVLAAVHSGLRLARDGVVAPVLPRQRRDGDVPPERTP
jgi:hypothetical protein